MGTSSFPIAEHLLAVADETARQRTAFQSLALTALQTLDRMCYVERRAAEAAISLAQRQKLQHDAQLGRWIHELAELEATRHALYQMLSPHSATMLGRTQSAGNAVEPSWWFALCEALHALEQGAAGLHALTAGQPRSSATRTVGTLMAKLLEHHYHALFAEAEQWLG